MTRAAPAGRGGAAVATPASRTFLLSPAHCGGIRAGYLFDPRARFPLAARLHGGEPVSLGEVFAFLSGLYFRGKLAYAARFAGRLPDGGPAVRVITTNRGLLAPDTAVTLAEVQAFGEVDIDAREPRYREPLERDAARLASLASGPVVLLGSIATGKYLDVLTAALGERLVYPVDFIGRGDMSRGALLLRAARAGVELSYESARPVSRPS